METSLPKEIAGIVALAVVAGLAFNALSPLGVRLRSEAVAADTPLPRGDRGIYRNETLKIQFVPATSGTAAGESVAVGSAEDQPWVTWPQVKQLQASGPLVLVDARHPGAYEAGHIPGAVSLPMTGKAALLEEFAAKHPKDTAIVVYCTSQTCSVSEQLASLLASRFGFTNIRILNGGYAEYLAAEGKR